MNKWIVAIFVIYIAGRVTLVHDAKISKPKVVGGFQVKISSVPFLVTKILQLAFCIRGQGFRCGASIISASWGISAQHCLNSGKPLAKLYYVRAGSSLSIAGGTLHRIKKFYFFDSKFFDGKSIPEHDIVLFKVSTNFRFSNTVKPAKLPVKGSIPPKLLQVSGWGRTDMSIEAYPISVFVQSANVSRVKWEDCIRANDWYKFAVMKDKHLCYGEGSADACYGDSGGPLANFDTIYGIVSFGDDCGMRPGVYTDVLYYRRWIKRITNV